MRSFLHPGRTSAALSVLLLSFLLNACTKEPNGTGIGIIPPEDLVAADSSILYPSQAVTFPATFGTGQGNVLIVGNSPLCESVGLLSFSDIPDTLKGAAVSSAILTLSPTYSFGDTLASFLMSVHEVASAWKADSVYWSSITPGFYNSASVGSLTGVFPDTGTVAISLDPALIQRWFQQRTDSVPVNGVALVASGGTNIVKGFGSFIWGTPPRLEIAYAKSGRLDTLQLITGSSAYAAHPGSLSIPQGRFVIAGGVGQRGYLFADVRSIPARAIIHDARLILSVDQQATLLNHYSVDSLVAYFVTDSSSKAYSTTGYQPSAPRSLTSQTLEVPIGLIVQRWVSGESNQGIVLRPLAESYRLDRFVFYGAQADTLLRPRLIIRYTPVK